MLVRRFPEGIYVVEGITLDDEELEAELRLSHVMPGRPGGIKVNGKNSAANCDATLPVVGEIEREGQTPDVLV